MTDDLEPRLQALLDAAHDLRIAAEPLRAGAVVPDECDYQALERYDDAEDRYDASHAAYHEVRS